MKKSHENHRQRDCQHQSQRDWEFSTFSVPEEDHEKFRNSMHETAAHSVAEFQKTLALVKKQFQHDDPLNIIASFAFYGLMTTVTDEGAGQEAMLSNIEQQHAEMLQAIMLTIPLKDWGTNPLAPTTMQIIFDNMPKLAETFFHQRILANSQVTDEQEKAILSLQDRIRFHTYVVRNWGYFADVIRISTELYGPLDDPFSDYYGFGISHLVQVMASITAELERRVSEHHGLLQKVLCGRDSRQLIELYYQNVPGLVGKPEEMIAALPPGITRDDTAGILLAHLELRLREYSIFKPNEIANLTCLPPKVIEKILESVSLIPGALEGTNPERLFLDNPVWTAPNIKHGDDFFIPMPQAVFSHIHRIVDRLGKAASLKGKLEERRSRFLESTLGEALASALPNAVIETNQKWKSDGQLFETDCIVIVDRVVIIVEAKSHRLTPEGMRGAPERVKRHIKKLVLEPSIQSSRLEKLIVAAKNGDKIAVETVSKLGIDPSKVDRVIRLSVTLDDLSVLCSAESELKRVGWIPVDHHLAPTLSIADFMCLIEILDYPALMIHYLYERTFFQKSLELIGDELDFVGLYLETGFNLAEFEKQHANDIFIPEMSGPLDRYYNSRDAGVKLPKPKAKLRPLFREIIEQLSQKRPEGWTMASLHLLSCANYEEQQNVEESLAELKGIVQNNFHDPRHVNSLYIHPPLERKARVIFYLFPRVLRPSHRATMVQLAAKALEESKSEECCVFSRCIDNWNVPYETIYLVRKNCAKFPS